MHKESIDFQLSTNDTNIIKGIAICAMLFHHLFYTTNAYGDFTQQLAIICKVCVSMFLFVSGYGLTIQYSKLNSNSIRDKTSRTSKFLLRRFSKFYLNYWAIFIILVPLGVFALGRSLPVAYGTENSIWSSLVKDILGIQGFDSYIITWWFNALIISLYILFPFLYWIMKRNILAIGFLILLFLWPRDYIVENFFYIFYLWNPNLVIYTLVFSLGIFIALHIELLNVILNKIPVIATFILGISISISLCFIRQIWIKEYINAIATDAFITIFITLSVTSICRLAKIQMKPLISLGKHSMNIYLTHTFILMFFFPNVIFETKIPLIIFIALLGESFAISFLLEYVKKKLRFYSLQDLIRHFLR